MELGSMRALHRGQHKFCVVLAFLVCLTGALVALSTIGELRDWESQHYCCRKTDAAETRRTCFAELLREGKLKEQARANGYSRDDCRAYGNNASWSEPAQMQPWDSAKTPPPPVKNRCKHHGYPGQSRFCTPKCPCDVGQGNCNEGSGRLSTGLIDDDCAQGLRCFKNAGPFFARFKSRRPAVNVCVKERWEPGSTVGACAAGFYGDVVFARSAGSRPQVQCLSCPPGRVNPMVAQWGSHACIECEAGSYDASHSTRANPRACTLCATGKTSAAGATTCISLSQPPTAPPARAPPPPPAPLPAKQNECTSKSCCDDPGKLRAQLKAWAITYPSQSKTLGGITSCAAVPAFMEGKGCGALGQYCRKTCGRCGGPSLSPPPPPPPPGTVDKDGYCTTKLNLPNAPKNVPCKCKALPAGTGTTSGRAFLQVLQKIYPRPSRATRLPTSMTGGKTGERGWNSCHDGADNDGDGLVDCADPECMGHYRCPDHPGTESRAECHDGKDNDKDGIYDCADPECKTDPCCYVPAPCYPSTDWKKFCNGLHNDKTQRPPWYGPRGGSGGLGNRPGRPQPPKPAPPPKLVVTTKGCRRDTCQNGGKCWLDVGDVVKCLCIAPYSGETCDREHKKVRKPNPAPPPQPPPPAPGQPKEHVPPPASPPQICDADKCRSGTCNHCMNGGRCFVDVGAADAIKCACASGFSGGQCDTSDKAKGCVDLPDSKIIKLSDGAVKSCKQMSAGLCQNPQPLQACCKSCAALKKSQPKPGAQDCGRMGRNYCNSGVCFIDPNDNLREVTCKCDPLHSGGRCETLKGGASGRRLRGRAEFPSDWMEGAPKNGNDNRERTPDGGGGGGGDVWLNEPPSPAQRTVPAPAPVPAAARQQQMWDGGINTPVWPGGASGKLLQHLLHAPAPAAATVELGRAMDPAQGPVTGPSSDDSSDLEFDSETAVDPALKPSTPTPTPGLFRKALPSAARAWREEPMRLFSYDRITTGQGINLLESGDLFGSSVTAIGDVNNDGVTDLAIGAIGHDGDLDDGGTMFSRGAVFILLMKPTGWPQAAVDVARHWSFLGPYSGFGISVTAVGDLDGNGVPDMVVGCTPPESPKQVPGCIFVVYLNRRAEAIGYTKLCAGQAGTWLSSSFGASVTSLRDTDRDGVPELAVGAPRELQPDGTVRGAVYILSPKLCAHDVAACEKHTASGMHEYSQYRSNWLRSTAKGLDFGGGGHTSRIDFHDGSDQDDLSENGAAQLGIGWGHSVASGDWDADGTPDLVVGAPNGGGSKGAVFMVLLNKLVDGSWAAKNHLNIVNGAPRGSAARALQGGDSFGSAVAVADFNSDGVLDIAVGAPNDDDGGVDVGAVYIFYRCGSSANPSTAAICRAGEWRQFLGSQKMSRCMGGLPADQLKPYDRLGFSLGAGDLSGGGLSELLIGAAMADGDGPAGMPVRETGAVFVAFLSPSDVRPSGIGKIENYGKQAQRKQREVETSSAGHQAVINSVMAKDSALPCNDMDFEHIYRNSAVAITLMSLAMPLAASFTGCCCGAMPLETSPQFSIAFTTSWVVFFVGLTLSVPITLLSSKQHLYAEPLIFVMAHTVIAFVLMLRARSIAHRLASNVDDELSDLAGPREVVGLQGEYDDASTETALVEDDVEVVKKLAETAAGAASTTTGMTAEEREDAADLALAALIAAGGHEWKVAATILEGKTVSEDDFGDDEMKQDVLQDSLQLFRRSMSVTSSLGAATFGSARAGVNRLRTLSTSALGDTLTRGGGASRDMIARNDGNNPSDDIESFSLENGLDSNGNEPMRRSFVMRALNRPAQVGVMGSDAMLAAALADGATASRGAGAAAAASIYAQPVSPRGTPMNVNASMETADGAMVAMIHERRNAQRQNQAASILAQLEAEDGGGGGGGGGGANPFAVGASAGGGGRAAAGGGLLGRFRRGGAAAGGGGSPLVAREGVGTREVNPLQALQASTPDASRDPAMARSRTV